MECQDTREIKFRRPVGSSVGWPIGGVKKRRREWRGRQEWSRRGRKGERRQEREEATMICLFLHFFLRQRNSVLIEFHTLKCRKPVSTHQPSSATAFCQPTILASFHHHLNSSILVLLHRIPPSMFPPPHPLLSLPTWTNPPPRAHHKERLCRKRGRQCVSAFKRRKSSERTCRSSPPASCSSSSLLSVGRTWAPASMEEEQSDRKRKRKADKREREEEDRWTWEGSQ
eukprot:752456-Hanusia_phi.AAC.4